MNFKNISIIVALLAAQTMAAPSKGRCVVRGKKEAEAPKNEVSDVEASEPEVTQPVFAPIEDLSDSEASAPETTTVYVEEPTDDVDDEEECLTPECYEASKRILKNLDISVDPCDDFYEFACGNWLRENEIPDDQYSYDGFTVAQLRNQAVLKEILNSKYTPNNKLSKEDQEFEKKTFDKVINLFNSCMNTEKINEAGKTPLINFLDELKINENKEALKTREGLTDLLINLHNKSIFTLLGTGSITNFEDPDHYLYGLTQSSLTLNKPNYEESEKIGYLRELISGAFELIFGDDKSRDIKKLTRDVLAFEQKLAEISVPDDEMQKPSDYFHKYTLAMLEEDLPNINWERYYNTLLKNFDVKTSIKEDTTLVNLTPRYFKALKKVLDETDADTIAAYAEWTVIRDLGENLGDDYKKPFKNFQDKIYGATKEKERVEQCIDFVENNMGMALGKYFIEKTYTTDDKKVVQETIENIKEAMIARIPKMTWLDKETADYAITKVKSIVDRVGYPDYLNNPKELYEKYETLNITDDYFNNMITIAQDANRKDFNRGVEDVDKSEWSMTPQTVNAYYSPLTNSINFPAGIFQLPFFNSQEPDYLNYGGIGMVVGHELTHAFDDSGKLYDATGKYRNWWTDKTLQQFTELTDCFIDQYSQYYIEDEQGKKYNVNGKLTLNENLADNGGLARAYEAWQLSLKKEENKARNKKLPGLSEFTPEQLFYISFGQSWCGKTRPNYAVQRVLSNSHSPGKFRVLGTLSNSKHFAETFQCKKNQKLNPDDKCLIW